MGRQWAAEARAAAREAGLSVPRYLDLDNARWESVPTRADADRAGLSDACTCIYGTPCVDKGGCREWGRRFAVAVLNGWDPGDSDSV